MDLKTTLYSQPLLIQKILVILSIYRGEADRLKKQEDRDEYYADVVRGLKNVDLDLSTGKFEFDMEIIMDKDPIAIHFQHCGEVVTVIFPDGGEISFKINWINELMKYLREAYMLVTHNFI